ncbi:MAG: calcium/sodium antiporter [Lachnospirales bacterium]
MDYLFLVIGIALLVKGADFFVSGSSSVAKRLGVEEFIIGLTLVAFGTSAPELAVSVTASLQGQNEIAISNVIGSNIFNILTVLGISSIILPLNVDKNILSKDLPFSIVATLAVFIMCIDIPLGNGTTNAISRGDGLLLLLFFCIFLFYTFSYAAKNKVVSNDNQTETLPLLTSVFLSILGLICVITGANIVIKHATNIAVAFNISQTIIGLTIVAIGTSLPELVTSIVAAKKGNSDIAIGNIVGSNIFNIVFILGTTATIDTVTVNSSNIMDIIIATIVSCILLVMAFTSRKIQRSEGIVLVFLLVLYYLFITFR